MVRLCFSKMLISVLCLFCLLISFSSQASAVITPLNDDTEFVKQVYLDFLNRAPEAEGLTYWVGQLDAGTFDRSELVEQYLNSNEFGVTVSPVVRLYFTYYLRIPDYSGLMFWVNSYAAGMSLNDISDAFAEAQEFIDRYGSLTNEEFISKMYVNVYGRQPDAEGLGYWTDILDTSALTRGQVMVEFSSAEEYLSISSNQVYVTMTYMGLLRRSPELDGFEYWAGVMDGGASGLGLISSFLLSDEYAARFDVTLSAYIQSRVYENRTTDSAYIYLSPPDTVNFDQVSDLSLLDSSGEIVIELSEFSKYFDNNYFYNCTGTECGFKNRVNYYYFARSNQITGGVYTFRLITTEGEVFTEDVSYFGKVNVAYVDSNTILTTWNSDGSLTISWNNPVLETGQVMGDSRRIRLTSPDPDKVFYGVVSINDETITIPEDIIAQAFNNQERNLLNIYVQDRLYDDDNHNYARGYSSSIEFRPDPILPVRYLVFDGINAESDKILELDWSGEIIQGKLDIVSANIVVNQPTIDISLTLREPIDTMNQGLSYMVDFDLDLDDNYSSNDPYVMVEHDDYGYPHCWVSDSSICSNNVTSNVLSISIETTNAYDISQVQQTTPAKVISMKYDPIDDSYHHIDTLPW